MITKVGFFSLCVFAASMHEKQLNLFNTYILDKLWPKPTPMLSI